MKVSELIYEILDILKAASSDDSYYTEEHVLFLCKKYRSFLIKKEQEKDRNTQDSSSEFETQEICLDLEPKKNDLLCTNGSYLWSIQKVPQLLKANLPRIYPLDYYQNVNISYVSRDRMRYVGSNKYLKNVIYASLGPDMHLYITSSNPQFKYLKKLRLSAVFDDFEAAAELSCDINTEGSENCDILDMEFPIRDYLVPPLIELVVKELAPNVYRREDTKNDAADDTPVLNRTSK